VKLSVDNKSAVSLIKNPVYHDRTKHIDLRFHYIREYMENKQILTEFTNTDSQASS
jgi:hypothetical protein